MRAVLAISLPVQTKEEVEERAQKAHKTTSAYVLDALEIVKQMISEEELLARIKEAERNYKKGKTKILKSLKDLIRD